MHSQIFEKLAPLVCDSHIHIGRFKEGYYFSPEKIYKKLQKLGIKKWAISSLSTVDNDFSIVAQEMHTLIDLAPEQTVPLLWVTPEMLNESYDLSKFDILPFAGIKIHGFADSWDPAGESLKKVFGIAYERRLPILVHTGGKPESDPIVYEMLCSQFKELVVILAHGRPIEQAIKVMQNNPNVYVDTAFMPIEHVAYLRKYVDSDRILFGTDFPIDKYYYPEQSVTTRYKRRVEVLVDLIGEQQFLKWASGNFHEVYKLQ